MSTRYLCSLSGTCEADTVNEEVGYASLEECTQECLGSTEKELDYLTLQYLLDFDLEVESIAPSDRVELIRRETGVVVTAEDSLWVLASMAKVESDYPQEIEALLKYPALWDLICEYEGSNAREEVASLGTLEALEWARNGGEVTPGIWSSYLTNSDYNEEAKEILFDEVQSMFGYLAEYHKPESDTPGLAALWSLSYKDERAAKWYQELLEEYQEWRVGHGLERDDEEWE